MEAHHHVLTTVALFAASAAHAQVALAESNPSDQAAQTYQSAAAA